MIRSDSMRESAPCPSLPQRAALHQLHREEVVLVRHAPVDDLDDVGVAERRQRGGLLVEPGDELGSFASFCGSSFTATCRASDCCSARQTSPIAPRPMTSISR